MPQVHEPIIGLPDFKIISTNGTNTVEIEAEYIGPIVCIHCQSPRLRKKESFLRCLKHHCIGIHKSVLVVRTHKFYCRNCRRYFNQRLPGVQPYQRVTENFKEQVALRHHHGTSKRVTSQTMGLGSATVERYYQRHLKLVHNEFKNASCPKVLGIDEKHFTKKLGYMTTFANLQKHRVYDVALGRSEASLAGFIGSIPDKKNCKVVVMDLCQPFRNIAHKHFPKALVVADRFHVVKLINHHFLKTWAQLDEEGRKSRGLLSLMRRHEWSPMKDSSRANLKRYLEENPAVAAIYDFKQSLMKLILSRVYSKSQARPLVAELLDKIQALKNSNFGNLVTLGNTLDDWKEEIVRMWRFSKTNSITEGLHRRMDEILNRAYGMRNFGNFRIRVKAFCG
jgi:transposase